MKQNCRKLKEICLGAPRIFYFFICFYSFLFFLFFCVFLFFLFFFIFFYVFLFFSIFFIIGFFFSLFSYFFLFFQVFSVLEGNWIHNFKYCLLCLIMFVYFFDSFHYLLQFGIIYSYLSLLFIIIIYYLLFFPVWLWSLLIRLPVLIEDCSCSCSCS